MEETADAARGRNVLLALIIAVLIFDAGVSIFWLSQMPLSLDSPRGSVELVKRLGRFLVTLLLLLMLYRGSSIATVITIILFGLAALLAIPATLETPFLFPMLVLCGAFPLVLMFSEDVGAFLEGQRSRRRSTSEQVMGPAGRSTAEVSDATERGRVT